jgi:phosphoribosyl-AMP cyclohydrolase
MTPAALAEVRFDSDGLVPVVVQDADTGDVLMLAYMNDQALNLTRETGQAHFWSRGRGKLWRKGETSGNVQIVQDVRINCEQNSLLLRVRQHGAVCHDGYPTCFYREVADDGTLNIVRDREFDPAMVYGHTGIGDSSPTSPVVDQVVDQLEVATRLQYAAYAYLRDHDLTAESSTSRRLRNPEEDFHERVSDELRELAGVLDGTHQHSDRQSDLCLEASQVMYWLLGWALRSGVSWAQLRPDKALTTSDDLTPDTVAMLLRREAGQWANAPGTGNDVAATSHATLALVGQACHAGGINPADPVLHDLEELRSRPYLAEFFSTQQS